MAMIDLQECVDAWMGTDGQDVTFETMTQFLANHAVIAPRAEIEQLKSLVDAGGPYTREREDRELGQPR